MDENTKHVIIYAVLAATIFGSLCLADYLTGQSINLPSNAGISVVVISVWIVVDRSSMRKKQEAAKFRATKTKKKKKRK